MAKLRSLCDESRGARESRREGCSGCGWDDEVVALGPSGPGWAYQGAPPAEIAVVNEGSRLELPPARARDREHGSTFRLSSDFFTAEMRCSARA